MSIKCKLYSISLLLFLSFIGTTQAKAEAKQSIKHRKRRTNFLRFDSTTPPKYGHYKCNCCKLVDKDNGGAQSYCNDHSKSCHGTESFFHPNGVKCT